MKKLEGNRKDWIKNILIVFLIILLLLTFFSNTIMNYSLAEVSSSYITSGSISTAIRGTGTIQSVDPYNVTISEGRKVESVNVRKGDTVSKGDVLFVLEEGESTEVADAKKAYQALLEQYDSAIIDNQIGSDVITAFYRMESLELWAKITINAVILGGSHDIDEKNIQKLIDLRSYYRITGRHPGYKMYNPDDDILHKKED